MVSFFTSVGPFRHLSINIISYWVTFPSVKLHVCLSKFKAWSVSTNSGRNPSVSKFVQGVMLSAIQLHDFPCAAVLYKESKVAGEVWLLGRIRVEWKASSFSNKWEFLLTTWDYSGFTTRTLSFTKLVYHCLLVEWRLPLLFQMRGWKLMQDLVAKACKVTVTARLRAKGRGHMHTLFVLWSKEGLGWESRDLGGTAHVGGMLLLPSYCCVWGCTYKMRPHIKALAVYIGVAQCWGSHPPSSIR